MPKNFFRKLKESITNSNSYVNAGNKSHDFERTRDVLFSSKTLGQLTSAVKYINNFNEKYKITEKSPEFTYFERMINIMKIKLRSKRFDVDGNLDESEQMKRWILTSNIKLRNIIKEALGDLSWLEDGKEMREAVERDGTIGPTEPKGPVEPQGLAGTDGDDENGELDWVGDIKSTLKDPEFSWDNKEYWIDISHISSREETDVIYDYLKTLFPKTLFPNDRIKHTHSYKKKWSDSYTGIVIHCGDAIDDEEPKPQRNNICMMEKYFDEDDWVGNKTVYVDGKELLTYIRLNNDDEELDESLEWSDKDASFDDKDKSFSNDPTWTNDEYWTTNPEKSYWKQGDSGGDMGES